MTTTTTKGKHTPGPWIVDDEYQDDVRDSHGLLVVSAYGDYNLPKVQANARLIAAAPEMAELLLSVEHSPEAAWHRWLDKRDAVLRKAGLL